jgi:DNA processing protein
VTFPVLKRRESEFPRLLLELHDPPPQLYMRGGPASVLHEPAVAIVGARSCSSYGAQVARMVARELGAAGVVVVSGLARGIDGEAHRGTLEAGGQTVAVLGCGIDRDYPRRHAELARRIEASGAIVSEYPPGTEPAPWRFPARNRIVAGLCLATVVVEARSRSGALITADFALELGREVFAVPGEITAGLSAGTNDLLRQGATPLLAARDILDVLGIEPRAKGRAALSTAAEDLLRLLADEAREADGLTRASGRTSAEVGAALVELELAGLVASADGLYRAVVAV